ncbi:MAG TPA: hypothetical protein VNP04_20685 [Alphaproteobacteria bacterium]|nr:hypothetical protein [Alphaproteobacteria bacterium]
MMQQYAAVETNGAAAAAILAAGIGSFILGLLTTLAAASEAIGKVLAFYSPVGPLSGKTSVAVVIWLAVWGLLHRTWKNRQVNFGPVFIGTLILIALAFLGTFPPVFEAFGE